MKAYEKKERQYEEKISSLTRWMTLMTIYATAMTVGAIVSLSERIDEGTYRSVKDNTFVHYAEKKDKDDMKNTMTIVDSLGVKYVLVDSEKSSAITAADYQHQFLDKICISKLNKEERCYSRDDTTKNKYVMNLFNKYDNIYNAQREYIRSRLEHEIQKK